MIISVRKAIGTGPTELAAFDQALVKAGVANFNLIYLSSVLPPNSQIQLEANHIPPKGEWGDKLYVVMAQMRTEKVNSEAWAGVGWIQDELTKKGLLVEHEGSSEQQVRRDISNSLTGLAQNRQLDLGDQQMEVIGARCTGEPICALVVAVFESAAWEGNKPAPTKSKLHRILKKKGK